VVFLHERAQDGHYETKLVLDTVQRFRRTEAGWRICHRSTSPVHTPIN
jgi:hypothetical protein